MLQHAIADTKRNSRAWRAGFGVLEHALRFLSSDKRYVFEETQLGASGAIIMSFFGAVFASMTLLLQLKCSGLELGLPFIGFAGIAIAALLAIRLPGEGLARPEGSGRVMLWSSIGEGIGLFIVANLLVNLGHVELLLPAMALVVGLHFIPIAYWVPFRPLYILAAVIILGGIVGLSIHQPTGGVIAGFTAAAALALASIAAIRRERSAKLHVQFSPTR